MFLNNLEPEREILTLDTNSITGTYAINRNRQFIDSDNVNICKKKLGDDELFIILLNIRSLKEKLQELEAILNDLLKKPHIIIITETWIKEEEIKFYNLNEYQMIANCRKDCRGGGIIIYIHDKINFNVLMNENFEKNHLIIFKINELNLKIGGIYRSPSSSNNLFLEKLDDILERTENLILFGDFNFNLLNETDSNTVSYLDTIQNNNYAILNEINEESYTYFENRGEYKSILDHVVSDNSLELGKTKIEINDVSFTDHRLLKFTCNFKIENNISNNQIQIIDYENIANALNSFDFEKHNYREYLEFLKETVNKFTRIKKFRGNNSKKIWIDNEIKIELKKRKNLFDLKKNNPNNEIYRTEFNKQKKLVKNAIIEKRKKYFDTKFENTLNNPKLFWKNINELVYNKQSENKSDIVIKNDDGEVLSGAKAAELLNNYYIDLPQNLIEKSYGDINSIDHSFTGNYSSANSIFFIATIEEEIHEIISNLNNSNSVGTDGYSSKLYKKCSVPMSKILSFYINQAIEEGNFPDNLKVAKIIPVFKRCGDKSDYKMYRPISILKIESKIFEACIYERLYKFLEKKNFFEANQFGFTRNSNTTSACITYIDKIQRALNEKKLVCTIFLDVAKAFDCVDRKLLLKKLNQIGIRGNAYELLSTYVNERLQIVELDGEQSSTGKTKFNVAQGSKLGPLLFLIFMNDIFNLKLNGSLQLYADDSSITYICNDIDTLRSQIEEDLLKICEWFKNNLLVLHGDKTKFLSFNSNRSEFDNLGNLFLNGAKIEKVNEFRYLGLIIDSNLTWNSHIDHVIKKVKPYIGVFKRIAYICNDHVKKLLYYSFFHSHIMYLITVWSGTSNQNIKKIKTLQNKCIRNLFLNKYRQGKLNTRDLYKEQNIINFEHLIELELNINLHKIINRKLKANIDIQYIHQVHEHNTRQTKQMRKIKTKNKWGEKSIINRCIDIYNKINSPLKREKKCIRFKKKLKKLILEKQFNNTK